MTASRILKSGTMNSAGTKRLSAVAPAAQGKGASGPVAPARAKIISREDGHVVIQVVCPCGQEIQLRCATGVSA